MSEKIITKILVWTLIDFDKALDRKLMISQGIFLDLPDSLKSSTFIDLTKASDITCSSKGEVTKPQRY